MVQGWVYYKIQTIRNQNMILKTYIYLLAMLLIIPSTISIPYSCPTTASPIVLGQITVVCLHIVYYQVVNGTTTNTTNTYAFKMTVDKFSALKVTNLRSKLVTHTSGKIYAVVQGQNSDKYIEMKLFDPQISGGIYRKLLSIVINLQTGSITQITSDNAGCGTCNTITGDQVCGDNTGNQCYAKRATYPPDSDPRIFVSWIGTDNNGEHMLSHTKRLSRFTQYSIGNIYNSAISAFTS